MAVPGMAAHGISPHSAAPSVHTPAMASHGLTPHGSTPPRTISDKPSVPAMSRYGFAPRTNSQYAALSYKQGKDQTVRQSAITKMIGYGWSPNTAAAIVGNLMGESELNPKAINPGDATGGGDSVGIAQWNNSRLKGIRDLFGPTPTLNQQLDYVDRELRGTAQVPAAGARRAGRQLAANPDQSVNQASLVFYNGYEQQRGDLFKPAPPSAHMSRRQQEARDALASLGSPDSGGPKVTVADTSPGIVEQFMGMGKTFVGTFAPKLSPIAGIASGIVSDAAKGDTGNVQSRLKDLITLGSGMFGGPVGTMIGGVVNSQIDNLVTSTPFAFTPSAGSPGARFLADKTNGNGTGQNPTWADATNKALPAIGGTADTPSAGTTTPSASADGSSPTASASPWVMNGGGLVLAGVLLIAGVWVMVAGTPKGMNLQILQGKP